MSKFSAYKEKKLRDPEFKREYDALESEFDIIQAMIDARKQSGLTQKELAERTGINQADISKLDAAAWDAYLDWLFNLEYDRMGIPKPDLVVYLRVDPEVSQGLMARRYGGNEEKKDIHERDLAYLRHCQAAAAFCADRLGWKTVECCVDGQMRSIESIQGDIRALVDTLL